MTEEEVFPFQSGGRMKSVSRKLPREYTYRVGLKGCTGLFSKNENTLFNFYDYKNT